MSPSIQDIWWLHAGACLFAGMLAWTIGLAVHRGLRISHAARGYWFIVWALAVLPTGVAIAFHGFMPADVVWPLSSPVPLPSVIDPGVLSGGLEARLHEVRAPSGIWARLEPLLLLLYVTGAGVAAVRSCRGALAVRHLVRASRPVNAAALPGPLGTAERQRLDRLGIALRTTTSPVSPFVVCWPQRAIVIPTSLLERLSDSQLAMVLRHEASHLAQYDPQRAALMRLVGVVLWLNPFLRLIAGRVQVAAELCCDAAATGEDQAARRAYAGAYLEALRLSARIATPSPLLAFSHHDPGSHKLRIRQMVQGDSRRSLALPLRIVLAALALVAGSALAAVQIGAASTVSDPLAVATSPSVPVASTAASSRHDDAGAASVAVAGPAGSSVRFGFPVAEPSINSGYGAAGGVRTRPHRGVDFAAKRGTPVLAPASGIVTAATTRYPDGANYGTVVVLDHGGGWQTLYAHLDGFDVQPGQRVAAGTQIGRAGTTGKVTGPHLHMEMLLNGQRVDPEPLLR
ncbi:M23/M56 family metallopeptidase [Luteimonas sp. A649]